MLVNGVERAKTDSKGRYSLSFEKIPGKYEIEPDHKDYHFEPLKITIDENTKEIPNIQATTAYLCGSVYTIKDNKYE